MSVLIQTSKGDIVIDLFTELAPLACKNFLKLCKIKYYHYCTFHYVDKVCLLITLVSFVECALGLLGFCDTNR